jgi:hypothetical protein
VFPGQPARRLRATLAGIAQAQQLSAVDAFRLRGECHQLGQKLVADMDNKSMLADMIIPRTWDRYTDTNYNATDNRCYVLIRQSPSVHGENLGINCRRVYLYDGQTADMQAFTEDGPACRYIQEGAFEASHHGAVFGEKIDEKLGVDLGFGAARDYIAGKMGH